MSRLAAVCLGTLLAAASARAQKPESTLVDQLLDRIVAGEKQFVERMRQHHPLLETYVQEFNESDPAAPPVRDHYLLGQMKFEQDLSFRVFQASNGFQPKRGLFTKSQSFLPEGWAQMVFLDATEFDREHYSFDFVRREFLGDVRCLVFDVKPRAARSSGKFMGRIWVEDGDYSVVRSNGTYTNTKGMALFFLDREVYYHFDSWRVNVAPGVWMPAFVYIEDSPDRERGKQNVRFRAQSRLWGYQTQRGGRLAELTEILVENAEAVQDQSAARESSPVESQRGWERQAEDNIIQRLERGGMLAARGPADDVLNTVVNNLLVSAELNLDVRCRILLTTPLETFAVGQTIVISRGLLDVLPDEASLALVLAEELAHIALAHRTVTRYAFADQVMFEDHDMLARMRMVRTRQEMDDASSKAMQIIAVSPYKDKLSNAGLFLKALDGRAGRLPNLIQANLGNQLGGTENLRRFAEVLSKAPPLDEAKIEQIVALPLGSRIKLDPWCNSVTMLRTRPVALLSAREKMPLEVSPFILHLTRIALPTGKKLADSGARSKP
jgi:hypothetical protein